MNNRILLLSILLLQFSVLQAGTPLGGLTCAISPDQSTLIAGGDNRTLYLLDPNTLEVRNRVWIGTTINALSYNKDGKIIVLEDSDGTVYLHNASDFSRISSHEKLEHISVAQQVDIGAGMDSAYNANAARFFSLSDGSEKGKVSLPKDSRVSVFGINPEGTVLAILEEEKEDESEKKVSYNDVPKDLRGLERDIFEMKNDGETAVFCLYKVPSGEKIAEHKLFYTSGSNAKIMFDGEDALVVNYSNENARITPEGKVTMFKVGDSYNYGMGCSTQHDLIVTGGLRDGSVKTIKSMSEVKFNIRRLPGWPEYFKGFCVGNNNQIFGTTSGYRVIKISKTGDIEKETPCF